MRGSDDLVAAGGLFEPRGAQLGRPLERLEVDVHQSEAVAEAGRPLEVVLRTPMEVAVDRHALRDGALELAQRGAHEHDPVRVVDTSRIVGRVDRGTAVLRDVNGRWRPERLDEARPP